MFTSSIVVFGQFPDALFPRFDEFSWITREIRRSGLCRYRAMILLIYCAFDFLYVKLCSDEYGCYLFGNRRRLSLIYGCRVGFRLKQLDLCSNGGTFRLHCLDL